VAREVKVVERSDLDEIHLVLVRALGTDVEALIHHLMAAFATFGFVTEHIKLSEGIDAMRPDLAGRQLEKGSYQYYKQYMNAGNELREVDAATLAYYAVQTVAERREHALKKNPNRGILYIHDSVMHAAEASVFRRTYGNSAFVVSVNRSEAKRRKRLSQRIRAHSRDLSKVDGQVKTLMDRDMGKAPEGSGRALSFERTFHRADVFLDGELHDCEIDANGESTQPLIRHFMRQLFSYPHGTPTIEEAMMAHAFTASRRSGALARRVGAAIANSRGDLICVGRNDVPRPLGGLYDANDANSRADANYKFRRSSFPILAKTVRGADSSDLVKLEMLVEVVRAAIEDGIAGEADYSKLLKRLLKSTRIQKSQFLELIAYGRTVHAEMDAITTAARLGVSVRGASLYTTTFPCHECGRHIVAAGIREVVFVEPYPKSRVRQLHADAVQLLDDSTLHREKNKVCFRPFVGIAARRLPELFSTVDRKVTKPTKPRTYGLATPWKASKKSRVRRSVAGDPVIREIRRVAVLEAEDSAVAAVNKRLFDLGLTTRPGV
jgi:deoxycytidylate deaminase